MPSNIAELQAAADKAQADLAAAQAERTPRTAGNVVHDIVTKIASLLGNHPELEALIKELEGLYEEFSAEPTAETATDAATKGAPIPLYPAAPHHAIEPKE
jgi:hypothetical protein